MQPMCEVSPINRCDVYCIIMVDKCMKFNATNQVKALDEYILMMESACTSEPVDENPKCDHSNECS